MGTLCRLNVCSASITLWLPQIKCSTSREHGLTAAASCKWLEPRKDGQRMPISRGKATQQSEERWESGGAGQEWVEQ